MEHVTIELVNATIGYKTKNKATIVASNLNGSLLKGKLVSLVGRNGCGKSTLLRTIAGFQPLLEGRVIQEGKEIQEYSIQERARILSIVTTNTMHVQDMTVFDLVAMGRSPYTGFWGKLGQKDKEIIAEVNNVSDFSCIKTMDKTEAISILNEYGFDKFLLNSDISNMPSDPLSVPKTIRELKKLGFNQKEIDKVSQKNAQKFFNI